SSISVSLILMKKNIHELCAFIDLARSLQVDNVKTLYVRIYPEDYRKKSGRNDEIQESESLYFHQNESDQMVRKAKKIASKLGVGFEHEPLFSETRVEKTCHEPWKSLFIGTNGDVYPCAGSEILFKNKVKNKTYHCGNLLEQDIHEFWNNAFWQALRRTHLRSGCETNIPECTCCGNMITLRGPGFQDAHVLNWTPSEKSDLTL
ncbi:MAG: SPASM domain-containing protein, partial [Deltaproteobacteria bacterium]|nr:SPASM domain-containing protein [Deltaproteobacteria bacterium]